MTAQPTQDEINEALGFSSLPPELADYISKFIKELKQPKYVKPLSVLELSSLFQSFFVKIDKEVFLMLQPQIEQNGHVASTNRPQGRRKSSLFRRSSSNVASELSQEEINKQLRRNILNDMKISKIMDMCEDELFNTLGISCEGMFKNSADFMEYNSLVEKKLEILSSMDSVDREFLGFQGEIPESILKKFPLLPERESPKEKLEILCEIHNELALQETSNDYILSALMYIIVKRQVLLKNIFLEIQYIKLFRCKKKLVEKELFVLTNMEAVLMFIDKFEDAMYPELVVISEKIKLPEFAQLPATPASYIDLGMKSVGSVFDSVKGSMFSRLMPVQTPPRAVSPALQVDEKYRYRGRKFEDLTVSELREIFDTYIKLTG